MEFHFIQFRKIQNAAQYKWLPRHGDKNLLYRTWEWRKWHRSICLYIFRLYFNFKVYKVTWVYVFDISSGDKMSWKHIYIFGTCYLRGDKVTSNIYLICQVGKNAMKTHIFDTSNLRGIKWHGNIYLICPVGKKMSWKHIYLVHLTWGRIKWHGNVYLIHHTWGGG